MLAAVLRGEPDWLVDGTIVTVAATLGTLPGSSAFSPDGHWIVYQEQVRGRGVRGGVFVQPFPSTGARYQLPRVDDDHHPIWSRDGRALIITPGPATLAEIAFQTTPSVAFGVPVEDDKPDKGPSINGRPLIGPGPPQSVIRPGPTRPPHRSWWRCGTWTAAWRTR
jgi:hypothetical protein